MKDTKVSVAGFSVIDTLYDEVDFRSESYLKFLSRAKADGGLKTGQLTFAADLEMFAGKPLHSILAEITGGREGSGRNLGGPAIVGAVNAAQILFNEKASFRFFGLAGDDAEAAWLDNMLSKMPVDCVCPRTAGHTPATHVLSDPHAGGGKGERTFISDIGVGGRADAGELPDEFFAADVAWFGGTALVPPLHGRLTEYLKRAKAKGMFTIVNTIFDFISEKNNPSVPWSLGSGPESYIHTDLLLMDWDEACHLSGENTLPEIDAFFSASGVSVFAITHGAKEFHLRSDGRIFEKLPLSSFCVSDLVGRDLALHPELRGDTTGCGDNFAGGFAASFIRQLAEGKSSGLSLRDAAAWAAASGGFACFSLGGTYVEREAGEKFKALKRYHDAWLEQ